MTMDGGRLDIDDVFDVLGVERRRATLWILSDQETTLALADIADKVAVREHHAPISEIPAEEVKCIYLDLYHTHIPKLAQKGVINYHREGEEVTPTENVDHVVSYLQVLDGVDTTTGLDQCT